MPGDMAVQNPHARVIRLEADGHVAVARQQGHVAPGRVVVLEGPVGDVVLVEGPVLLRQQHEVVPVQVHRVRDRHEHPLPARDLVLRALRPHDDVHPVLSGVVLRHQRVFRAVEAVVPEVVDQWVREVEPHRRVRHVPAGEVAVRHRVVFVRPFEPDFEVVARVLVNCRDTECQSSPHPKEFGGWQKPSELTVVFRWTNIVGDHGYKTFVRLVSARHVEPITLGRRLCGAASVVAYDPQLVAGLVLFDIETPIRTGDADPVILILDWDQIVGRGCFDNNVIPLADTNQNRVSVVRLNGYKVGGDNQEHVLVDGEDESRGGRSVDQAQEILATLFEDLLEDGRRVDLFGLAIRVRVFGAVVEAFAVQDDGLHLRRRVSKLDREILEGAVMAPVTKQEWVQSDIKVCRRRSVKRDWSSKTIRILKRVMTVIPRSAILRDVEFVGIGIVGRNGALCDRVDTVMLEGIEHTDTVPVDSRAVVFQEVGDRDLDSVTPASFDPWPRILVIKGFAAVRPSNSIRIDVLVGNVEMILLFIGLAPQQPRSGRDAKMR